MKDKLQEAAERAERWANVHEKKMRLVARISYIQGAKIESEIDKEAIQELEAENAQLLQQNKELREAFKQSVDLNISALGNSFTRGVDYKQWSKLLTP